MKVKWTEVRPLHTIPEIYWGEDLSELDSHYSGEIIGVTRSFLGGTHVHVICDDGEIRSVKSSLVKGINQES